MWITAFQRAFLSWRSSVSVESAVVSKFREEILKGQHQVAIVLPRSLLSIQHETLLLNEERWSAVLIVNQVTSIKTSNAPEHQHYGKAAYWIEGISLTSLFFFLPWQQWKQGCHCLDGTYRRSHHSGWNPPTYKQDFFFFFCRPVLQNLVFKYAWINKSYESSTK